MIKLTKDTKILIVGLGVIGGGYAKALTDAGYTVKCITKNQSDIDYAITNKMIKEGTTETDSTLIGEAELIIFALYPTVFIDWLRKNQALISSGTLITDVCGVKSSVIKEVYSILRDDVEFISHHPMAGREKSGVEYSSPEVFRGANFIIVPTERNTKQAIEVCRELGGVLGFSRISELTADEHDRMIAHLSQLTHALAVVLMNTNDTEGLEKYTGDSFRDLTRIAKINDRMWAELFLMNKDALLAEMNAFICKMTEFRDMLEQDDKDKMRSAMKHATKRRELFDKPKS